MAARVFTVGREFPGGVAEYIPFRSDTSLFDADVIIFTPTFSGYSTYERYRGRPLMSESDSPGLLRDCEHWRAELKAAVETGKVVFVPLLKPEEVYYHTGERTYSGTGRSRVATDNVDDVTSYHSLPIKLNGLVSKRGTEISILGDLGPLALYWSQFGSASEYEVYFDAKGLKPLLGTKKREMVVGGFTVTATGGALVLLPPVKWDEAALTYSRGESTFWRKEATVLGERLISTIIAASDAFRRGGKRSPPPDWSADEIYALAAERRLQGDAARIDVEISALAERRSALQMEIEKAAQLRDLLFETGKPLEEAIIASLRTLGFVAEQYEDGDSEFDAVFTSAEGRFLGEAEGKDAKAINIDKMSQLGRNLQEDFSREGVSEFAKGVLFGNAFRLKPPGERLGFFTEKCCKAARRLDVALVRTPDLFGPAQYLAETSDNGYASACRHAIFEAKGTVVKFPEPPTASVGPRSNPDTSVTGDAAVE